MQPNVNLLSPTPMEMVVSLALLALLISVPVYLIFRFLRVYERRNGRGAQNGQPNAALDTRLAAIESQLTALRAQIDSLDAARVAAPGPPSSFTPPKPANDDATRFAPPTPFGRTPT